MNLKTLKLSCSHLSMHVGIGPLCQAVGCSDQLCLGLRMLMRLPVQLLLLSCCLLRLPLLYGACAPMSTLIRRQKVRPK